MASSPVYDDVSLISKGLYRIVSDIVGPECIIKLRRKAWEIRDNVDNCDSYNISTNVTSGSRADGFEFKTSDLDQMHIDRNSIGLTRSALITLTYNSIPTVLLVEAENMSPGFTLIRCLRYDQNNETLKHALVLRGNGVYVSSQQIRESFMSTSMTECHGPCQTSKMLGLDGDDAFTIRCPIWPKQAISFIRRSLHKGWPSYDTLTNICRDGCLFVPINSKHQQYSDVDGLQWRISFSLAEKKLVHSMNHCQFLCYGLSKLFLNEVLQKATSNEDLLCSYFMKTAIFWEISENQFDWSPFNFLTKFRDVFSRLINWVSMGYCPNFFIPDNNMFQGKICGEVQRTLLSTLRNLYMDGYWSLLHCPSLCENLSMIIFQPEITYTLSINEQEYVPITIIELKRLQVICKFNVYMSVAQTDRIIKILINMLLMMKIESVVTLCAFRLGVNHALQAYAQNLLSSQNSLSFPNRRNRIGYRKNKTAESILLKSETFFCMNDFIMIKHIYMSGNYHRTIEMIHYTRHELQSQSYMYKWTLDSDVIMTALRQGLSYDAVVKTFIVSYVKMDEDTTVEELVPECLAINETTGGALLFIPPLVFLNFLLILSYTRLGENHRRHDILDELHTLLYHDDSHHIRIIDKAISWEILGICQQLCGDRHVAYVSFLHALDDDYNYFKQATLERLNSLGN